MYCVSCCSLETVLNSCSKVSTAARTRCGWASPVLLAETHLDGHDLAIDATFIDLAKAASSDDPILMQEGQDILRKVVVA